MCENKTLRIAELNLEMGKITKKMYEKLESLKNTNLIDVINSDILVLTECGEIVENESNIYDEIKEILGCIWVFGKKTNYNWIFICIWNHNIEDVHIIEVEHIIKDVIDKPTKSENEDSFEQEPSPDEISSDNVLVEITLNDDAKTKCVVQGIRFNTSWSNIKRYKQVAKYCTITQISHFIQDTINNKPDIIIGDFNVKTEIYDRKQLIKSHISEIISKIKDSCSDKKWLEPIDVHYKNLDGIDINWIEYDKKELFEDVLCKKLLGERECYHSWPLESAEVGYCTKDTTRPDRIILNSSKVELKNAFYYPKLGKGQNPKNLIPDWSSDHSIIIADVVVK